MNNRKYKSGLSGSALQSIQKATLSFRYKGVICQKNPFDLALYTKLLWELKPKNIIEIGTAEGGSALWFADTLRSYGIDGVVHSIDKNEKLTSINDERINFIQGDLFNMANILPISYVKDLERPLLIIEDSAHLFETTFFILNYFKDILNKDEFIIIEDGIVNDLGNEYSHYENGPNRAIRKFLRENNMNFAIENEYCDYYGHNYTWNTNGYIRKIS